MMRILSSVLALSVALPGASAIIVADGSPCGSECGNVLDKTSPDDMTCDQSGYSSGAGQVFQGCMDCQITSEYNTSTETDTEYLLYNLRYTVSYCLFGYPENKLVVSTPCITTKACGPFQEAIEYKNLSTKLDNYGYCDAWPVDDAADFNGCRDCLRVGGQEFLANFFTVLQAGCEQKPKKGVPVSIEGDIFSTTKVNITDPSPIVAVDPSWFEHGPLTTGAKVGIAFAGVFVVLCIAGFGIIWNGKRRRRAFLRNLEAKHGHNGWPAPQQSEMRESMHETPTSQRPLRGWDDSPMSVYAEQNFPKYFSPYSSQYNSPVSAQNGVNMQWPDSAHGVSHPVGMPMTNPEQDGRWDPVAVQGYAQTTGAEAYEMHEVDSAGGSSSRGKQRMQTENPVMLGHPGYGRPENSPPLRYNVADGDSHEYPRA